MVSVRGLLAMAALAPSTAWRLPTTEMSGSPLARTSPCAPQGVLKLRPAGVSPSRGQRRRSTLMAMEPFKPDVAQAVLGLAAQPIMWWSLYVLKTTGCGLPAGPYGLFGALEGVSYLIVAGFVLASLYSKVTTGSGLPAGRGGLLGLAEGLSFLTATAGLVVFGFQVLDYGYIPNAVPVEGGVCS